VNKISLKLARSIINELYRTKFPEDIARQYHVSRQHIYTLAKRLREEYGFNIASPKENKTLCQRLRNRKRDLFRETVERYSKTYGKETPDIGCLVYLKDKYFHLTEDEAQKTVDFIFGTLGVEMERIAKTTRKRKKEKKVA